MLPRQTLLLLPFLLVACSDDDAPATRADSGSDSVSVPDSVSDSAPDSAPDSASDTAPDTSSPTSLALPGDKFYPESLHASKDGTLFVGSLGTGQVVKLAPGTTTATTFLAAGDPKGVAGVFVDDAASMLWVCATDLSTTPPGSEVRGYDLSTATKKTTLTFGTAAFCNDFAVDATGNLFVSDSFGKIWRLAKGGSALTVWKSDALLAPSTATGFGADGLALDGAGNLYVNTFTDGRLLRIPIESDGSAGAVTTITVTPSLQTPDGMRPLDASTLVLVDGTAGTLVKVAIAGTAGTATVLGTSANGPTGVVKVGASFWVSEGQLGHLLGFIPGPPTTPFVVRAFPVP